jgi:1-acyl-sn-glycerol-3-phosphate acyltransferase
MRQSPTMSLQGRTFPLEQAGTAARDFRLLASMAVRAYLHTYHRLQIHGQEKLPRTGSFVMIANHTSHLDALCLLSALPVSRLRNAFPAAAHDYFCTGLRRFALSALVNSIPFSRRAHIRQSLGLCSELLSGPANVLILFPEGTRSATGRLADFRPGIGSLLAGTNIPVVPCAIRGAMAAFPKGGFFPKPTGVQLVIGQPRRYRDLPAGRQSHHRIAGDLHDAVGELLCR